MHFDLRFDKGDLVSVYSFYPSGSMKIVGWLGDGSVSDLVSATSALIASLIALSAF